MSQIALGTLLFGGAPGRPPVSQRAARAILHEFAEAGGNFVDTASNYGQRRESERVIGDVLRSDRDWWVLGTKYGASTSPNDPNSSGTQRKNLVQSVERSLKTLGVDHIDLLWVHVWDAFTPLEEVLHGLEDIVRSGKVLYVGFSNAPAWVVSHVVGMADERRWARPIAIQVPYNLSERRVEREHLPMAKALDLAVVAWAPLAGGWLARAQSVATRTDGAHEVSDGESALAIALQEAAERIDATPAQVAIAWLCAQRARAQIVPVVGARERRQLRETLGGVFMTLPDRELHALNAVTEISAELPWRMAGFYGRTLQRVHNHRSHSVIPPQVEMELDSFRSPPPAVQVFRPPPDEGR